MGLIPTQHKVIAVAAFAALFTAVLGIYFYGTKLLGMGEAKTAVTKFGGIPNKIRRMITRQKNG
jgi:hypothetical protein